MASQSAIKLTKLVERFELEVLNQGKKLRSVSHPRR